MVLRKGTEVALRPVAVDIVLGTQLIRTLVMEKEVKDIAYFTWSKISEICAHFIIMIETSHSW